MCVFPCVLFIDVFMYFLHAGALAEWSPCGRAESAVPLRVRTCRALAGVRLVRRGGKPEDRIDLRMSVANNACIQNNAVQKTAVQ